ncbi:MAG TPA: SRPBCC domain-containing protein [Trebonia sp.]|jgi:uncharacterized protein YndB with AHSA1/START domain|nr:SRPBCC domain-containing protein [Trebonia sp.]
MEHLAAAIRHSALVRAKPSEVFAVLSTGSGWSSWFTSEAVFEARPGGAVRFVWRNWGPDAIDVTDQGSVLAAEPDHSLVFTWGDPPSRVSIVIDPCDRGCIVRLTEDQLPPGEAGIERLADCAAGWGEALTLLKFYVEHGLTY